MSRTKPKNKTVPGISIDDGRLSILSDVHNNNNSLFGLDSQCVSPLLFFQSRNTKVEEPEKCMTGKNKDTLMKNYLKNLFLFEFLLVPDLLCSYVIESPITTCETSTIITSTLRVRH